MKKQISAPQVNVVTLLKEDVIATSGTPSAALTNGGFAISGLSVE